VCCSVLQCVAVRCIVLQCVAVCCSVLQCVAVCCSVWQCVAVPKCHCKWDRLQLFTQVIESLVCREERWGAGVEYRFQEFNEPYAPS